MTKRFTRHVADIKLWALRTGSRWQCFDIGIFGSLSLGNDNVFADIVKGDFVGSEKITITADPFFLNASSLYIY